MIPIFIFIFFIWTLVTLKLMYDVYNEKKVNEYLYGSIPSVFTTIGVLGTFIGIYIGLQDFDVNNITDSIPSLLEGLKGAFITSIIGIILSIFFGRISEYIAGIKQKDFIPEDTKVLNEINNNLKLINESLFDNQKQINNKIEKELFKNSEKVTKSVESSNIFLSEKLIGAINNNSTKLHTSFDNHADTFKDFKKLNIDSINKIKNYMVENQLKHLKGIKEEIKNQITNSNDNTQKQLDKFDELSKILAENNVKALVEVMKKVTEEFNKQMSELIGRLVKENFEELNNSVKQLNTWQNENKKMVSDLTDKYIDTTDKFKIASDAIQNISKNTDVIIENSAKLVDKNSKLQELLNKLNQIMVEDTKFEKSTENILQAIETIKSNINAFDKTTNKLNDWVQKEHGIKESVNALLVKLDEVSKIRDYNGEFWNETKKQLNEGVNIVSSSTKNLNSNLNNINQEFQSQLQTILESLDNLIRRIIAKYDIK